MRSGTWFGLLGVVGFSLTLPATKVAIGAFDPVLLTLGRGLLASVIAALALAFYRPPLPSRSEWRSLALVAGGVILGFPLLLAWSLGSLPASHGAVVLGLLPLATAAVGALRAGERPSPGFWLAGAAGSLVVIGFGLREGGGRFHPADLGLLAAVAAAAAGYAEGGRLARTLGGWQVISWALVLAAPFLAIPFLVLVNRHGMTGTAEAWVAFAYLGLISQLGAFFAWYKGLALGGVARTSQLQLLQPFLTVVASTLLLGERLGAETLFAAALVVATVALGRRAPVVRVPMGES